MPYVTGQIRNDQGDEQHSWVTTSPVHRILSDSLQKWGKSGGSTGTKETIRYVKHLTLNKLPCEITAVFFHQKKKKNLKKKRCKAIYSVTK